MEKFIPAGVICWGGKIFGAWGVTFFEASGGSRDAAGIERRMPVYGTHMFVSADVWVGGIAFA